MPDHLPAVLIALLLGAAFGLWLGRRRSVEAPDTEEDSPPATEPPEDKTSTAGEIESFLDHLPLGLLLVDEKGLIGYANRELQRIAGGREPRPGSAPIEVFGDHRYVEAIEGAREEGGVREAEIAGLAPDGEPVIHRVRAEPVDGGRCWVLVTDATAEVTTEQVRKDFVANASHELRTPLTLINGYVETLQDGLLDDREMAERSLEVMAKHGARLARLVDDMLAISRLEGSDPNLNLEEFDLAACARDIVDNLGSLVAERDALVTIDAPDDEEGGRFEGDRFYWDQIFLNLIENALKENPQGGIKVKVRIGAEAGDGSRRITVTDNGVGIQSSDLPFLFKRFYRGAKHHGNDVVKGTGLGLSIVKRAVEAHGGTIGVESTPGRRTRFTIVLGG